MVSNIVKTRRIIYNDDGDARWTDGGGGPEVFLAARFNYCRRSQVDTYFWCIGNGELPSFGRPEPVKLGDASAVTIQAARSAGIEIFASLRMNDTHDALAAPPPAAGEPGSQPADPRCPGFTYPLKLERPDLLIAERKERKKGSILYMTWSAFDYAHEEVRNHRLDYVRQMCSEYDWDGFEMDFCRHPAYFKMGEVKKHIDTMTAFVGQVRALLDEIAANRRKPYLLAVRVPCTEKHALRIGLDIRKWLAGGWIDKLVAGGGYMPYSERFRELVDLGHRYGAQVYPCINVSMASPSHTGDDLVAERIRGMASNLWFEGADGIYLFNLFVPVDSDSIGASDTYRVLHEIGDAAALEGLDKIYVPEAQRCHLYAQYTAPPHPLPVRLIDCAPISLKIGDTLERAMVAGEIHEIVLRLKMTDLLAEENIEAQINGETVHVARRSEQTPGEEVPGTVWFEGNVTNAPLRRGDNTIRVFPSTDCWGKATTEIEDVTLLVRYRQ